MLEDAIDIVKTAVAGDQSARKALDFITNHLQGVQKLLFKEVQQKARDTAIEVAYRVLYEAVIKECGELEVYIGNANTGEDVRERFVVLLRQLPLPPAKEATPSNEPAG